MDVETLLERVRERLRTPLPCGVPEIDRLIADALRPGKLLRPDLVVRSAAAARSGRDTEAVHDAVAERRVVEGALSMELLHVATLVHDDIIDASSVRRGRASVVASAGVGTAIVVGDLLLARGVAAAAQSSPAAPAVWSRTLACMAAGQLREEGLTAAPSLEAHAEYARLKTAELFRASAEIGALAVGAAPDVVAAHGTFGLHFGMAFQHVDDLLDTIGDPRRMGKPVGVDAGNGVPTAVSLLAEDDRLEDVSALVAAELDLARAALLADEAGTGLGAWGADGLRRAFDAAVDTDHRAGTDRLTSAFGRLEHAPDIHRRTEPRTCHPSSATA